MVLTRHFHQRKELAMKQTKSNVEKLAIPSKGQALYWDDDLHGFGVRVTPSGARSYIVQGRANGKERRVTLGQHGAPLSKTETLTADRARKLAMGIIASLSKGVDPVIEKKRKKTLAVTLGEVAEVYCRERRTKKGGELTALTKRDIEKHISKSFADWKEKPIINITRDLCSSRFIELSAIGQTQANQAFRILRSLLNYAMESYRPGNVPILLENPVKVISGKKMWNPNKTKSGYIPVGRKNQKGKVEEVCKVGDVWNLLQDKRTASDVLPSGRTGADIVLFLMLTGCRWSEAAELRWNDVNLDDGSWHISDPKNHNPITFPLSAPARAMLAERPRVKGNPHVFPSRVKNGNGFVDNARPTMKSVSEIAGLHLSAHDLRRTFMAIGIKNKIAMWKLKLLTNHIAKGDVTIDNYTETNDLRYLSGEVEQIAALIVEQGAIAAAGNVVQLRGAA